MMQSGLVTLIQISGSMHERRSMMTIFYRLMNDFDMENLIEVLMTIGTSFHLKAAAVHASFSRSFDHA